MAVRNPAVVKDPTRVPGSKPKAERSEDDYVYVLPCPFCGSTPMLRWVTKSPEGRVLQWLLACVNAACPIKPGATGPSYNLLQMDWNNRDQGLKQTVRAQL